MSGMVAHRPPNGWLSRPGPRGEFTETHKLRANRGSNNDEQISHSVSTQDTAHALPMCNSAFGTERCRGHVRADRPACRI